MVSIQTDKMTASDKALNERIKRYLRECRSIPELRAPNCTGKYLFYGVNDGLCPLCRLYEKKKRDRDIRDRYEQRTRDMARRNRQESIAAQQLNAFLDDIYPIAQSVLKDD